jgi:hypothetical protein
MLELFQQRSRGIENNNYETHLNKGRQARIQQAKAAIVPSTTSAPTKFCMMMARQRRATRRVSINLETAIKITSALSRPIKFLSP